MAKWLNIILFLAILSVSCESEYENTLVTQEENIDKYIADNFEDYEVVHNGGTSRVIISKGSGNSIENGDVVSFSYAGYIFEDDGPTEFFTSGTKTDVTIGNNDIIKGLDLGLAGALMREEAAILFSARYGYGKNALNVVPEQSALLFIVKITSIRKHQD